MMPSSIASLASGGGASAAAVASTSATNISDHAPAVGPQQLDQAAQLAPAPAGRAPAAAELGAPVRSRRALTAPPPVSRGSRLRKTWSGSPFAAISRVQLGLAQQLLVRAARGDLAVLEHDDVVGQRDRRQPVGDHERRAARPSPRAARP